MDRIITWVDTRHAIGWRVGSLSMAGAQVSGEIFFNDGGELAGEVVAEGPALLVGGAGVGGGASRFQVAIWPRLSRV
jgi:hypothetical protein